MFMRFVCQAGSVIFGAIGVLLLTICVLQMGQGMAFAQTAGGGDCGDKCVNTNCGTWPDCASQTVCASAPGQTCPVNCTCLTSTRSCRCPP